MSTLTAATEQPTPAAHERLVHAVLQSALE
jgi:hypothetical protein